MKALVTGSAGFIGRYMVRALEDRGYEVHGIDIKDGIDALGWFRNNDVQYDLIVHCAYQVGGRASIDGLNLNLADNVQLDGAMFNYGIRTKSRRVLYFSSSAAYPVRLQTGKLPHSLRESDIAAGGDGAGFIGLPDAHYGWAKLTGEKLAVQARKLGLAVHVVRPFSGYAEDQSFDYPFPSIVKRAMEKDFTVWGPANQTRDWIHINDVLAACFRIIDRDIQEPINLCTGIGTTMGQVLQIAHYLYHGKRLMDYEIHYDLNKPTGVIHRVGNPEKMFGIYKPRTTLAQGINKALDCL